MQSQINFYKKESNKSFRVLNISQYFVFSVNEEKEKNNSKIRRVLVQIWTRLQDQINLCIYFIKLDTWLAAESFWKCIWQDSITKHGSQNTNSTILRLRCHLRRFLIRIITMAVVSKQIDNLHIRMKNVLFENHTAKLHNNCFHKMQVSWKSVHGAARGVSVLLTRNRKSNANIRFAL